MGRDVVCAPELCRRSVTPGKGLAHPDTCVLLPWQAAAPFHTRWYGMVWYGMVWDGDLTGWDWTGRDEMGRDVVCAPELCRRSATPGKELAHPDTCVPQSWQNAAPLQTRWYGMVWYGMVWDGDLTGWDWT